MYPPEPTSNIQIQSYKHNGKLHRVWRKNIILKETKTFIIGANDKTKVIESNGRVGITKEPAIFYFHSAFWFNIIGMLREDGVHYYCNMSSPFVYDKEAIKYIDYDLDVKVYPNMTYTILDEDEYEEHKEQMNYPAELDNTLHHHMNYLLNWIRQRKGPFAPGFIAEWYERYLTDC